MKPTSRSSRIKKRVELERYFLSAVLAHIEGGNVGECVARYPVSWRRFSDRRHQAIWRGLTVLDLSAGVEERVDILEGELSKGERGDLADNLWAEKELYRRAGALEWFEHELEGAGGCAVCGGKAYVREVAGAQPVAALADEYAKQLRFI